jgi:hypothetical protein
MNVYETALLCLVGVTGCLVYGLSKHATNDKTVALVKNEARTLHQAKAHKAGSLRRLSLDKFQPEHSETAKVVSVTPTPALIPRKTASVPSIAPQMPAAIPNATISPKLVAKPKGQPKPKLGLGPRGVPSKLGQRHGQDRLQPASPDILVPAPGMELQIHSLTLEPPDPADVKLINLSLPQHAETNELFDRVVQMAEASPIQPGSRGCGTAVLNTPKSANNVNSVGYKREITPRIDVGVEYVYKDGCYQNAITPISSLDMPADDGVNIRFNMRF